MSAPTPEAGLIERFRAGDEGAIRTIYSTNGGAVFALARSMTGDPELAADVVQIAFLKAWQAADRFQPGSAIAPWLYAIARRTAIDVGRHERRPTLGGHAREVDHPVAGPSFEQTWIVHEVRTAIDALPPAEREIIRLAHLEGMTHREIARQLDLPIGTVKSRSSRAHARLAGRLAHLRDVPIDLEPIDGPDP